MTRVQYKNWKTEIAWLRTRAKRCRFLSKKYNIASGGISPPGLDFDDLATQLSNRADSLEVAKGTAQTS